MIEDQAYHPQIGSLLRIIPWDCEGVEKPWGFPRDLEIVDRLIGRENVSGSSFRAAVRMGRVPMSDGDICVLLERVLFRHPTSCCITASASACFSGFWTSYKRDARLIIMLA